LENISTYRTLKTECESLFKEKGSKFYAYAIACYSEEEAKEILDTWRKNHHQARHLCYAYRLGLNGEQYRANDDGEPNNSAGMPILGQIQSFELTNVLVGVVRYFGGTKLGVGGLVTAYKTAAKEAIENGKIIELEVFEWLDLRFDYIDMPGVMNLLKKYKVDIENQNFELACLLKVRLKLEHKEIIKEELEGFDSLKIIIKGIY
jgi:uncharacterized YigZ family protein